MYKFEAQTKPRSKLQWQDIAYIHLRPGYRLIVEWNSQLSGSNNQKILNEFLDLESFIPWA